VKETHIDEMDLNMYRIIPAPPKWDLQEYIVTYLKEKSVAIPRRNPSSQ